MFCIVSFLFPPNIGQYTFLLHKATQALRHEIKAQGFIVFIEVTCVVAEFTAYAVTIGGPSYDGILCYYRALRVIQHEFQPDLVAFPEVVGSERGEPNTAWGDIMYRYLGLATLFTFWQFDAIPVKLGLHAKGRSVFKGNGKS
jgi:hypothetical protein